MSKVVDYCNCVSGAAINVVAEDYETLTLDRLQLIKARKNADMIITRPSGSRPLKLRAVENEDFNRHASYD
jgi:predicted aminopeptidase